MPYYDEIELGDEIGPVEKVATDDEVSDFCDIWGAPTPNRFTDSAVAAKAGMKGTIVPGIMTMAMMMMTDRSKQWQRSNYNDCYHHQPSLGHTADNSNS